MSRPPDKACPGCRRPHFGLDTDGRWRCLTCQPFERLEDAERLYVVYDEQLIEERQQMPSLPPPPQIAPTKPIEIPDLPEFRALLGNIESERNRLHHKAYEEGLLESFEEELDRAVSYVAMAVYSKDLNRAMGRIRDAKEALGRAQNLPYLKDKKAGMRFRLNQTIKAEMGSKIRWAHREEINNIIGSLAAMKDDLGDPRNPEDLWPELFSRLDDAGLEPNDLGNEYHYAGGSISYETFARNVRRKRPDR